MNDCPTSKKYPRINSRNEVFFLWVVICVVEGAVYLAIVGAVALAVRSLRGMLTAADKPKSA
jgi:hypothetical protein